jgi:hypothetical protein
MRFIPAFGRAVPVCNPDLCGTAEAVPYRYRLPSSIETMISTHAR